MSGAHLSVEKQSVLLFFFGHKHHPIQVMGPFFCAHFIDIKNICYLLTFLRSDSLGTSFEVYLKIFCWFKST